MSKRQPAYFPQSSFNDVPGPAQRPGDEQLLADSDRLQRLIFQDHQSVRNVIDGSPSPYPSIASPTRVHFPQRGMTGSTLITDDPPTSRPLCRTRYGGVALLHQGR
jgi:hypothetical protein